MFNSNPYTIEIERRKGVIAVAEANQAVWENKLNTLKSQDIESLHKQLEAAREVEAKKLDELNTVRINGITVAYKPYLPSFINVITFARSAVKQAASSYLTAKINEAELAYKKAKATRIATEELIEIIPSEDESIIKAAIAAFNKQIEAQDLEALKAQELKWDELLIPLNKLLKEQEELLAKEKNIRDIALDYDNKLSTAPDSYSRKAIHDRCEAEFGVGIPSKIVIQANRNISSIDRKIQKLKSRIEKKMQILGQPIEHIYIDASNLCYRQGEFVGLTYLIALVSSLPYKLSLVFDAKTKYKLQLNTDAIEALFPKDVMVHICTGKTQADETILMLADENPRNFVISNDTFSEFPDKQVVAQDRLLKHEILNDRILIPALDLMIMV
ncbi:hypothetical protein ACLS0R_09270 [Comamonas jiangduensis]|uniref:hypothetical protein n=1 Tax=Comamonas jiangduensis TaxID=1194168 RepID=UPI003BF80C61